MSLFEGKVISKIPGLELHDNKSNPSEPTVITEEEFKELNQWNLDFGRAGLNREDFIIKKTVKECIVMKTFDLKSGTKVMVDENRLVIDRTGAKSAMKTLVAGRTSGQMIIKISAITGMVHSADTLLICASGLPTPTDFKITSIGDVKQYPNCIVAKEKELVEVYQYLSGFIK